MVWEVLGPAEAPGSAPIASGTMTSTREGFGFEAHLVYMLHGFPKPFVKLKGVPQLPEHSGKAFDKSKHIYPQLFSLHSPSFFFHSFVHSFHKTGRARILVDFMIQWERE